MQRIAVTDEAVVITEIQDPLVSMYGTEMRPGTVTVHELPWNEISVISMSVAEIPPVGWRSVTLVVDVIWAEFLEVGEDADGFATALAKLSILSDVVVPDLDTVATLDLELWRRP